MRTVVSFVLALPRVGLAVPAGAGQLAGVTLPEHRPGDRPEPRSQRDGAAQQGHLQGVRRRHVLPAKQKDAGAVLPPTRRVAPCCTSRATSKRRRSRRRGRRVRREHPGRLCRGEEAVRPARGGDGRRRRGPAAGVHLRPRHRHDDQRQGQGQGDDRRQGVRRCACGPAGSVRSPAPARTSRPACSAPRSNPPPASTLPTAGPSRVRPFRLGRKASGGRSPSRR